MFVDTVELTVGSGRGGAGCTSYRREKFVSKGGPDGGDGGQGGHVYFETDRNTDTLSHYKNRKKIVAKNGQQGMGKKMHGKNGESITLKVPPGTQVLDAESGELLLDLMADGTKTLFLKGGKGGLGNWHFRSASNQLPNYSQPGLEGEFCNVRLELKLIADVGLVGFPNVGKSTLISTISNARPEVANYEFTTLTPNLGVVDADEMRSFVMADIPGIIEGASDGRGLGLEFLRHIERTKTLLFMIDIANYRDPVEQFKALQTELERYSEELAGRRYAIALTKIDAVGEEERGIKIKSFLSALGLAASESSRFGFEANLSFFEQNEYEAETDKPAFIAPLSSVVGLNVQAIKYALYDFVKSFRKEEEDEADRP